MDFATDAIVGKKAGKSPLQFSRPRKTVLTLLEESVNRRSVISKMKDTVPELSERFSVLLHKPAKLI
jgi:hypothetical protein